MKFLIAFTSLFAVLFADTIASNPGFNLVKRGLNEYFLTNETPQYFLEALQDYQLPHLFRDNGFKLYDNEEVCELCNLVVNFLILERSLGASRQTLAEEAEYVCTRLGIEDERVCHGSIDINLDIFLYIFDNYEDFTSDRLCGSVLQAMDCNGPITFDWSINIPPGSSRGPPIKTRDNHFNILHLTDIHYDPRYTPGSNADCSEPICCQDDQPVANITQRVCGFWSEYNWGDVPWALVEETIRQVKTHEFDYVYYTGDIISHRVWETSQQNNTRDIRKLLEYFQESFEVPVFVVFGNHEPHPLNVWPSEAVKSPNFTNNWLFDLASTYWPQLMKVQSDDVKEMILRGGYYTTSPRPGFRIIAINSNFCYTSNWWLIYDDVDPFGQLQWLSDTLKEAEENEESVHVLTHVPPSSSECLRTWSREYRRIVERFANTITGQFNGHTHRDEFHVYYNKSNSTQPVGVAFNGASVTPYNNANPSYKFFKVEDGFFTLVDYEEWTFNLTLANSRPNLLPPEWYKLYSFVETYGIEDLQPNSVGKILYKMTEDHSLLEKYFRYFYRDGDAGIKDGCDAQCQRDFLCDIAQSEFDDHTQCDYFVKLYDQS